MPNAAVVINVSLNNLVQVLNANSKLCGKQLLNIKFSEWSWWLVSTQTCEHDAPQQRWSQLVNCLCSKQMSTYFLCHASHHEEQICCHESMRPKRRSASHFPLWIVSSWRDATHREQCPAPLLPSHSPEVSGARFHRSWADWSALPKALRYPDFITPICSLL